MHSEELKRLMKAKRLQLETREQTWQPKTKPQKTRLEMSKHSDSQSATSFLSTWDTMFSLRMSRNRETSLFILPESMLDALIGTFERYIGKLVSKLLR
jgi:hypothetical protein